MRRPLTLRPAARPVTFPSCVCGDRVELVTMPTNQDRAAVRFRRCVSCGTESDHEVEGVPEQDATRLLEDAA